MAGAVVPDLSSLLRVARAWQAEVRRSPREIDAALEYVEFLEQAGDMSRRDAATWRWKILACWAELHRKPRRVEMGSGLVET